MLLRNYLKDILRRYEIKPKRRYGQSFLVDENLINRMVEYADVSGEDSIFDIGAGLGFLTELLAEKAGKVIAVESDIRLANILKEKFLNNNKIEVLLGDFLKFNIKDKYNKVVACPPYSIASKILFKLLDEKFELAILLLQREFASRMAANPGGKEYGRLTVMTYIKAEVEKLEEVPNTAFYPKPKVSSTIVKLKPREPFKISDMFLYESLVRYMFTQRNRKVRNVLRRLFEREIFKAPLEDFSSIPFLDRRVFTLRPEEFGEVVDAIDWKIAENKSVWT